jgi:hypothetical protein
MTEWISVKETKPRSNICAIVYNNKGFMSPQRAHYYHNHDVWVLDGHMIRDSITLDVTHYIEIPELPVKKIDK